MNMGTFYVWAYEETRSNRKPSLAAIEEAKNLLARFPDNKQVIFWTTRLGVKPAERIQGNPSTVPLPYSVSAEIGRFCSWAYEETRQRRLPTQLVIREAQRLLSRFPNNKQIIFWATRLGVRQGSFYRHSRLQTI